MAKEQQHKGGPFKYSAEMKAFELGEDGMAGDIRCHYVLEEEGKIVRRLAPYQFGSKDPAAEIRRGIEVFREFDSYEHLHVPHFDVIQANIADKDTFKPFLFVVDKVNGEPLPKVKFLPEERDEDYAVLTNFLNSATDYAEDRYADGRSFPDDNLSHNFVYGRDEDGIKKVYMVDLDLRFDAVELDEHPQSGKNTGFFYHFVYFIARHILMFEEKMGLPFTESRARLNAFLDSALSKSNLRTREVILEIQNLLGNR